MKNKKIIPMQIFFEESLHTDFKAKCAVEKIPMKDKIIELVKQYMNK